MASGALEPRQLLRRSSTVRRMALVRRLRVRSPVPVQLARALPLPTADAGYGASTGTVASSEAGSPADESLRPAPLWRAVGCGGAAALSWIGAVADVMAHNRAMCALAQNAAGRAACFDEWATDMESPLGVCCAVLHHYNAGRMDVVKRLMMRFVGLQPVPPSMMLIEACMRRLLDVSRYPTAVQDACTELVCWRANALAEPCARCGVATSRFPETGIVLRAPGLLVAVDWPRMHFLSACSSCSAINSVRFTYTLAAVRHTLLVALPEGLADAAWAACAVPMSIDDNSYVLTQMVQREGDRYICWIRDGAAAMADVGGPRGSGSAAWLECGVDGPVPVSDTRAGQSAATQPGARHVQLLAWEIVRQPEESLLLSPCSLSSEPTGCIGEPSVGADAALYDNRSVAALAQLGEQLEALLAAP